MHSRKAFLHTAISLIFSTGLGATAVYLTTSPAFAGNAFYKSYSTRLNSGRNTLIYKADEIGPDCSSSQIAATVKTYPKHGSLILTHGPVENTYSKSYPQSRCPSMTKNGVKGFYQPYTNFRGHDRVVISIKDEAGNTETSTIYLIVQ